MPVQVHRDVVMTRYKRACHKYNIPATASDGEWDCNDSFHLGPVVTDHMADMLLNHVCQGDTKFQA